MVHFCKMRISPGFFHFFKILIFWVVRGIKRAKNNQKIYLFQSATLYILETVNEIIKIFGTLVFFIGAHQQFF